MTWIQTTYRSPTEPDTPLPILINLDHVRSIRRTVQGKVRINWADRSRDPLIINEEWADFIKETWTK